MCGRGACMAWETCVTGGVHGRGYVWQGGMYGREGACVAGGRCGRGHVWQDGMCGRRVCMAGGMHGRGVHGREGMCSRGVCVAGETATAADGTLECILVYINVYLYMLCVLLKLCLQ